MKRIRFLSIMLFVVSILVCSPAFSAVHTLFSTLFSDSNPTLVASTSSAQIVRGIAEISILVNVDAAGSTGGVTLTVQLAGTTAPWIDVFSRTYTAATTDMITVTEAADRLRVQLIAVGVDGADNIDVFTFVRTID